jgi:hypothetical protein
MINTYTNLVLQVIILFIYFVNLFIIIGIIYVNSYKKIINKIK